MIKKGVTCRKSMKKHEVYGEIKDKFLIKNKKNNNIVTETIQKEGYLIFNRKPALFNTKEDANRYIDNNTKSEEEKAICNIEFSDNLYFNTGAILVEFEF